MAGAGWDFSSQPQTFSGEVLAKLRNGSLVKAAERGFRYYLSLLSSEEIVGQVIKEYFNSDLPNLSSLAAGWGRDLIVG